MSDQILGQGSQGVSSTKKRACRRLLRELVVNPSTTPESSIVAEIRRVKRQDTSWSREMC